MSALSGSFGTGTPAYSIGGTQVGITNTSANAYLSIYGGVGSTNGGFLLGGNNAENFANLFWSNGSNFMQIATTPVSSKVQFNIAGVVVGDINSNGFAPVAGKGIDFSANTASAGMTSELLDWYEEGTWTAGVSFGGASVGVALSNSVGYYTRIGNIVTVSCYLSLANKGSSTGAAQITGLPFTCVNNASGYSALSVLPINVTFAGQLSGYAAINTTNIDLIQSTGIALSDVGFANNSAFVLSLTYRAA
jgi:hypothetical protein